MTTYKSSNLSSTLTVTYTDGSTRRFDDVSSVTPDGGAVVAVTLTGTVYLFSLAVVYSMELR
jgi:hypothetical protein